MAAVASPPPGSPGPLMDWLDRELAEDPRFGSGRLKVHAAIARHERARGRDDPLPPGIEVPPPSPRRRDSDPVSMLSLGMLIALAVYGAVGGIGLTLLLH